MVEKYCRVGDAAAMACAAVDVAALIVHEARHICWADLIEASGECSIVYLVEDTFRWAMLERYSLDRDGDGVYEEGARADAGCSGLASVPLMDVY
jgi:hypothetical protein